MEYTVVAMEVADTVYYILNKCIKSFSFSDAYKTAINKMGDGKL